MEHMKYSIPPYANKNEGLVYVEWKNAFSENDILSIISIGESLPFNEAGIVNDKDSTILNLNARRSKTSWINLNNETEWLYEKIAYMVREVNADFYRFDIDGLYESLQYTIYESEKQSYYNWHTDIGVYGSRSITRKISMSLLLSDPYDFEGGDLEIWGSNNTTATKEKGCPIFFPSYNLHRVTPVTRGIRKSLVVWIGGPAFK